MAQLGPILDFMYSGQVNVVQDELNTFLATARVLKVNGLSTENNGIKETTGEPSELNSFVFTLYFTEPARAASPVYAPFSNSSSQLLQSQSHSSSNLFTNRSYEFQSYEEISKVLYCCIAINPSKMW